MSESTSFKIGLIINPIAGLGSAVGLHGTDGDNFQIAVAKGAVAQAKSRTIAALSNLNEKSKKSFKFFAPLGDMGGVALSELGIEFSIIDLVSKNPTTSLDTKNLAEKYLEIGVDLILFAGGDGTAIDIHSVVGEKVAILGIPCGVKMRSGIFSKFLNDISDLLNEISETEEIRFSPKEILDAQTDSNHYYGNSVFYGVAKSISGNNKITNSKARSISEVDLDFFELTKTIAEEIKLEPKTLYLIGPGSSTKPIKEQFGKKFDVRGVDAIFDGEIISTDMSEQEMLSLLSKYPDAKLIVGVIGGQGFLFGRGNQQISGHVIRRIGWGNIKVISAEAKILGLFPAELLVELQGFTNLDYIPRYLKVHNSPTRSILCRTSHCYLNKSEVDSVSQAIYGKVKVVNG